MRIFPNVIDGVVGASRVAVVTVDRTTAKARLDAGWPYSVVVVMG
jgi:hypothetical protein